MANLCVSYISYTPWGQELCLLIFVFLEPGTCNSTGTPMFIEWMNKVDLSCGLELWFKFIPFRLLPHYGNAIKVMIEQWLSAILIILL